MSFHRQGNHRGSPKRPSTPPDIDCPPYFLPLHSLEDRYRVISDLGNGSFGNVSLAKSNFKLGDASKFRPFHETLLERNEDFAHENAMNKKSGLVAIKTMNRRLEQLNDYLRVKEVKFILAIPYHKNLVQIYEMFLDDINYKLHIVMEVMDRNLYQLMKGRKNSKFSHASLKSVLSQVLCGIRHIHQNGYFHRDIKPENILVSSSNRFYDEKYIDSGALKYRDNFIVKIADYGLARHIDNIRPYTSYVSTRWYRAPEILLRKSWYSRPVDVWAFGSVAAEVATLRPLFPGSDELEQTWKVLEVLGTPASNNGFQNYIPSYGYWDEAPYLFTQLGLAFPQKKCVDISAIVSSPDLAPLCDVIRACLIWDPNTRADVEMICLMPYFKGTCVDDAMAAHFLSKVSRASFSNNNYQRSEKLAGIPSKASPQKEDVNIYQDTAIATVGSTASTTDVTYAFLRDLDSKPSSKVDVPEMCQRVHDVPDLTHERVDSVKTNDENLNYMNQSFRNACIEGNERDHGLKLIQTPNVPTQVASFIDYDHNGNSPTYGHLTKIVYDQEYFNNQHHNYTYGNESQYDHIVNQDFDALIAERKVPTPDNTKVSEIPSQVQSFTDLVDDDLLDQHVRYSRDTEEDIQNILGYKMQVLSGENNQQEESEFSTLLYSKYNLRQEGNASSYSPELDSFGIH